MLRGQEHVVRKVQVAAEVEFVVADVEFVVALGGASCVCLLCGAQVQALASVVASGPSP